MTTRSRPAWAALAQCFALAAAPVAPAAAQAAAADPEEPLDEGLKGFGYLAGLALGCVAQEQRKLLEREALDLNAEITRLLGTDRAFLFTAAFGNGTGIVLKVEECKTVLARYSARVAKFRQGKGGK